MEALRACVLAPLQPLPSASSAVSAEVVARGPGQPGPLYLELHAHTSQRRIAPEVLRTLVVQVGVIRVVGGIPGGLEHRVFLIFSGPEAEEALPISAELAAGEGRRQNSGGFHHQEEAEAELSDYRRTH